MSAASCTAEQLGWLLSALAPAICSAPHWAGDCSAVFPPAGLPLVRLIGLVAQPLVCDTSGSLANQRSSVGVLVEAVLRSAQVQRQRLVEQAEAGQAFSSPSMARAVGSN